jgi:hypothetical protein
VGPYWIELPLGQAVRDTFELRAALNGLADEERYRVWKESFSPVADYLDGVTELADRFGLDRLGIDGVDTVHAWCFAHQEALAFRGRWSRQRFSEGYQRFGPVIEVGDVVERDLGPFEVDGIRFAVKERDVVPVLRIGRRTARWDPTTEPRNVAFVRLRKRFGKRHEREIRDELDRMAHLANAEGAAPIDTRPNPIATSRGCSGTSASTRVRRRWPRGLA